MLNWDVLGGCAYSRQREDADDAAGARHVARRPTTLRALLRVQAYHGGLMLVKGAHSLPEIAHHIKGHTVAGLLLRCSGCHSRSAPAISEKSS